MQETYMKALTFYQPYATLIIIGAKLVETRPRRTHIRGRIAIHAGMNKTFLGLNDKYPLKLSFINEELLKVGYSSLYHLPRGAILGTIEIYDCLPIGDLIGTKYDTPKERAFGDWTDGRFGILMRDPVIFDKPVLIAGKQGFWNWKRVSKGEQI